MARENLHSRVVAWLKILLPVAALGLLSTLFLLSRSNEPADSIPFAKADLTQRAAEEGMTDASFSGATMRGDMVQFSAATMRPDPVDNRQFLAQAVSSRIALAGGGVINLTATSAQTDGGAVHVVLDEGVVLSSSTGYDITTDQIRADMSMPYLETAGEVVGRGPAGDFTAGKMQLSAPNGTGDAQLLFTQGVRLIYHPAGGSAASRNEDKE